MKIYNVYILEEIQKEVQAEMEIRRQMEREIQALKGKSNYTLIHCFITTDALNKKKKILHVPIFVCMWFKMQFSELLIDIHLIELNGFV